jgi:chromosome segregation ATPase
MDTSNLDHDRVFNLQLTVQRLEEELSLYRNGTTAQQLFDLVKEKEAEITDLKSSIADKDSKLRKLAKSSTEIITKFEDLQMCHRSTLLELAELTTRSEDDVRNHVAAVNEAKDKYAQLESECILEREAVHRCKELIEEKTIHIAQLTDQLVLKDGHISKLAGQLRDADQSIEKLQKRCAELVGEKAQKLRLLDEERQQMITHVQDFRVSGSAVCACALQGFTTVVVLHCI